MSTRCSSRAHVPSKLAVQAAASSQPPRKRSRSSPSSSASSIYRSSARVQEIPASVQEIPLTAEIINTIVQCVTNAVTHHLACGSSPKNLQSLAISASTQPATSSATLLEVPIGAPHSSTPQAKVAGTATTAPSAPGPSMGPSSSSSFADAVVNTSLAITQASISGIPGTPECLFSSPSLATDVRVLEKIRRKIWNNKYFDRSLLLPNSVVEDLYQLTVKGAEGNMVAPGICLEPVAKPHGLAVFTLGIFGWFWNHPYMFGLSSFKPPRLYG